MTGVPRRQRAPPLQQGLEHSRGRGHRGSPGGTREVSLLPAPVVGSNQKTDPGSSGGAGLRWAVGRENLSSVLPREGLNPGQPQGLERNKQQQPGAKTTNSLKPGVEKTAHRSHLAGLGVGQSSGKQSSLVMEAMRLLGGKDGRENANTVRKCVSNYKHGEGRVAICGTEK